MDRLEKEWSQAIERIPTAQKTAYLEASQKCPSIVATESNPEWFLRVESGHIDAAALRHVNYWKQRHSTFGERAFRPLLDLSGNGALNEDDIDMLKSGMISNLPSDEAGRPVVMTDLSLYEVKSKAEARSTYFRVQLYSCLLTSMNPMAQKHGLVGLRVVTDTQFNPEIIKNSLKLMASHLPHKLHEYHICCLPNGKTNVAKIVAPALLKTFRDALPDNAQLHVGSSGKDILPKLLRCGLRRSGLPASLGGDWVFREETLLPSTPLETPFSRTKHSAREILEISPYQEMEINEAEPEYAHASRKVRKAVGPCNDEPSKRAKQLNTDVHIGGVLSTDAPASGDATPNSMRAATLKAQNILNALRRAQSLSSVSSLRDFLTRPTVRKLVADSMKVNAPRQNVTSKVTREDRQSLSLEGNMEREKAKNRLLKKLIGAAQSRDKSRQVRRQSTTSQLRLSLLRRILCRSRASPVSVATRVEGTRFPAPSLHGSTSTMSVVVQALKTARQRSGRTVRELIAGPRFVARLQAVLNGKLSNDAVDTCDPIIADTQSNASKRQHSCQKVEKDGDDVRKELSEEKRKTQMLTLLVKRAKEKRTGQACGASFSRRSALQAALSSKIMKRLQHRKP